MPDAPPPPDTSGDDPAASGRAPDETPEPIDLLQPLFREQPLRPEGAEAPPMWLWMTIFGVMLFGTYYLGNYIGDFSPTPWLQAPDPVGAQVAAAEPDVDGEGLYNSRCASCHQTSGQGVTGVFPPLDQSRWVTEAKGVFIRILLHGVEGEIEVRGAVYNGNMPAWGAQLSDAELAAIMTYVRTNWSNDAGPITADEVAAVREAEAGRTQKWTPAELDTEAGRSIPGAAAWALPADTTMAARR
jgi:mono/diheme cytochrome c family protein